jgi:hypothetical protein
MVGDEAMVEVANFVMDCIPYLVLCLGSVLVLRRTMFWVYWLLSSCLVVCLVSVVTWLDVLKVGPVYQCKSSKLLCVSVPNG